MDTTKIFQSGFRVPPMVLAERRPSYQEPTFPIADKVQPPGGETVES